MEAQGIAAAEPLDLATGRALGHVTDLDTSRVTVELADHDLVVHVTVSALVALPAAQEFLIGQVEAVSQEPPSLRVMLLGTFRPGEGTAGSFRRGMSGYPHVGTRCHLIEGALLRGFMSILGEDVAPELRLELGRYVADRETAAVADGNRLFQRHVAVLGNTGAGKSWVVGLLLERAARLRHPNLVVFDLHGEYRPLTEARDDGIPQARRLRVAGPTDAGDLEHDVLHLPYWLLRREELMALVLNPADPHAADQVLRFTDHVTTLKEISLSDAGRGEALDTFTFDSPIPYPLESLLRKLRQDNAERIPRPPSTRLDEGPFYGRLTGLISRLEARAADPRYAFMFDPPERTLRYEWLGQAAAKLLASGIKVVDLSDVPSDVLPLVVAVLARLVYEVQLWVDPEQRTPVCLVCDEAHLYLPPAEHRGPVERVALDAFEAIAKEGRKYGVALLVVSQRPTDLSRTILSQCNNFVVMRMTNDHDQEIVRRVVPETMTGLMDLLPALDVGEALVIGDALLLPAPIKFDVPAVRPAGGTQPYWSLWAQRATQEDVVAAGVDALRKRLRRAPSSA